MRLPRDVSGRDLARRLARHYGYALRRTSGSHMTVTRVTEAGNHSVTVPPHRELRVGTLNAIVSEVAEVVDLSRRAVGKRSSGDRTTDPSRSLLPAGLVSGRVVCEVGAFPPASSLPWVG